MADLVNIFEAGLVAEAKGIIDIKDKPVEEEVLEEEVLEEVSDDEPESEDELPEEEAPDEPTIAAPAGMTTEEQDQFATLTPEMQGFISKREADRNAHFSRQTNETAEQRRQAEAALQQYNSQLEQVSAALENVTQQDLAPPDPALRDVDPEAYDNEMAAYVHSTHQQNQAQKQLAQVNAQRATQRQQLVTQEAARARELIPALGDPTEGPALSSRITQFALGQGYTQDEIGSASSRDVNVLYKAMLYEGLNGKGNKVVQKASKKAPKAMKPGASKSGSTKVRDKVQALRKRVRDGDSQAAVGIFEHMLEAEADGSSNRGF